MSVMSIRLTSQLRQYVLKWARQEKTDQSHAIRELLEYGWKFALLERYREGKMSVGLLAEELDMSISEVMDFLAEHGVSVNLDYDDYLQSVEALREVI